MFSYFSSDRVAELEAEVGSLQTQMQEQEEEASDAIAQWEETYTGAENKCSELEKELAVVKQKNGSLENRFETTEGDSEPLADAKSSLDAQIATLEDVIDEETDQVNDIEGDSPPADDSQGLEQLREELKAAHQALEQDEDVVHEWEGMWMPHVEYTK